MTNVPFWGPDFATLQAEDPGNCRDPAQRTRPARPKRVAVDRQRELHQSGGPWLPSDRR